MGPSGNPLGIRLESILDDLSASAADLSLDMPCLGSCGSTLVGMFAGEGVGWEEAVGAAELDFSELQDEEVVD